MLVFFTFQLGRRLFDTGTALAGAALVACCPVMLFMSLTPMADLPSAAFWIAALAMATRGTATATVVAAIFTGIAIVIRPNLVPLAIFPWLMTVVRCQSVAEAARRTGLFAAGSIWAPIAVAWINNLLYGSALSSGYGEVGPAFSFANAVANIRRYPAWWLESQGPIGLLCLISLWRRRGAVLREFLVTIAFAVSAILLYLFYLPFDAWWYLRFVLPAIPVLLLLCADTVAWVARRTSYDVRGRHGRVRALRRRALVQLHRGPRRAGDGIWRGALPRNGAVRRFGAASRRRHHHDAAQRQHPLLHRADDRAVGQP